MSIDPVCGQRVPERGNPQCTEYAAEDYFFCSPECPQRFNAEPDLCTADPGGGGQADRDRGIRRVANPGAGLRARIEQPHCH
jgi:YHS domain-containing protein